MRLGSLSAFILLILYEVHQSRHAAGQSPPSPKSPKSHPRCYSSSDYYKKLELKEQQSDNSAVISSNVYIGKISRHAAAARTQYSDQKRKGDKTERPQLPRLFYFDKDAEECVELKLSEALQSQIDESELFPDENLCLQLCKADGFIEKYCQKLPVYYVDIYNERLRHKLTKRCDLQPKQIYYYDIDSKRCVESTKGCLVGLNQFVELQHCQLACMVGA